MEIVIEESPEFFMYSVSRMQDVVLPCISFFQPELETSVQMGFLSSGDFQMYAM